MAGCLSLAFSALRAIGSALLNESVQCVTSAPCAYMHANTSSRYLPHPSNTKCAYAAPAPTPHMHYPFPPFPTHVPPFPPHPPPDSPTVHLKSRPQPHMYTPTTLGLVTDPNLKPYSVTPSNPHACQPQPLAPASMLHLSNPNQDPNCKPPPHPHPPLNPNLNPTHVQPRPRPHPWVPCTHCQPLAARRPALSV